MSKSTCFLKSLRIAKNLTVMMEMTRSSSPRNQLWKTLKTMMMKKILRRAWMSTNKRLLRTRKN